VGGGIPIRRSRVEIISSYYYCRAGNVDSADGSYEVTLMTKATLFPDGRVHWEPPVRPSTVVYSTMGVTSCPLGAAGDLQEFVYDRRRVLPVRQTAVHAQVRLMDLRRISGLTAINQSINQSIKVICNARTVISTLR